MVKINQLQKFWNKKKVFITGHTGFKGSWLIIILNLLGAQIYGYSLEPKRKSLFNEIIGKKIVKKNIYGNICNLIKLKSVIKKIKPDIIFHLAAQPLVIESYKKPIDTFYTNILGTANILEASRNVKSLKSIVIITSDKVYKAGENYNSFSENDELGGDDPYSASKAGAEILVNSYIKSFFYKTKLNNRISTARSGNVIGGGDYSRNRLIPDIIDSYNQKKKLIIRNPTNVRPWQHVIEPLIGYMLLAQKQIDRKINNRACWNFGPNQNNFLQVKQIVSLFQRFLNLKVELAKKKDFNETKILRLKNTKSIKKLKWIPKWDMNTICKKIIEWNELKKNKGNVRNICEHQVISYFED